MKRLLLPLALASLLGPIGAARAAEVPEGAQWLEADIESTDGVVLHADILRPKDLPETAKTPVILSIGPYFNHAGQTGALGPVQETPHDPVGPAEGPNERFHDFINGAKLMERGYTWVQVDLRGYGGSNGCLDWVGPGEQADTKAAVEWAATQPWSTGQVGMYGKSYDAVTGMAAANQNPKGLEAVVAQEPVYDMYRYLYADGVRFVNSAGTPALYDAIAATPGPLLDSPFYVVNSVNDPVCLADNYASQQDSNHDSEYWKARNLIPSAAQSKVPMFLTQGYLENNTKPDGAFDYFNSITAPKRAWFGMWDHVRGNDKEDDGRLKMGRKGWFNEVMRWFDRHVRDVKVEDDPPVVVQTSDGTWRAEQQWPPADVQMLKTELKPGEYTDDGNNSGTGSGAGNGLWTISPPLAHDAWYAGVPTAKLKITSSGSRDEVVAAVYSISPEREAMLLSRQASLIGSDGEVSLQLYGNDWKIPAGYRLGVHVTGSHAEWWLHAPTDETLTLESGTVELPFLTYNRPETIQGDPALRLEEWISDAPFELDEEVITSNETAGFGLPAPMTTAPVVTPPPPSGGGKGKLLRVRIARAGKKKAKKKKIVVYGDAPARAKLIVRLKRGKKRVAVKRVTTKVNAFRVKFKVRRPGRYRAIVVARADGKKLRKVSKRVRLRARPKAS